MNKPLMLAVATVVAAGATAAAAATTYDPAWPDRTPEWRGDQECWNPRAGHFERVRPGEVQNDLDFNNCRSPGVYNSYVAPGTYVAPAYVAPGNGVYIERRYVERPYVERYVERPYFPTREECWNPRAGHYEAVRRGEYQGDLDYGRCRVVRD